MEITYHKKAFIKIIGGLNHLFSSVVVPASSQSNFSSVSKQNGLVKIIINFTPSLDNSLIEEINKNNPDILISPQQLQKQLQRFYGQSRANLQAQKDVIFFELFEGKEDETGLLDSKIYFIHGPGEYEIKSIHIKGIDGGRGNGISPDLNEAKASVDIYVCEIEQMKLCCFWHIPEKKLTTGQLSSIGEIDVLIFPYKDAELKNHLKIFDFIYQINPVLILLIQAPCLNDRSIVLTLEDYKSNVNIKDFIKQAGEERVLFVDKFNLHKKDLAKINKSFVFLR